MRAAVVLAAALLTACAAPRPVVTAPVVVREAQVVERPVPVPCVAADQVPAAPRVLSAAELRALPDFEAVIALEQQRRALIEYHDKAAAVLAACVQQGEQQR